MFFSVYVEACNLACTELLMNSDYRPKIMSSC